MEQGDTKSADLVCPSCGTCSIIMAGVPAQATASDREGSAVASCSHCLRQYHSDVLPSFSSNYEDLSASAADDPCPLCRGSHRRVHSLCDRIAKQCFFVVTCEDCGDVRFP